MQNILYIDVSSFWVGYIPEIDRIIKYKIFCNFTGTIFPKMSRKTVDILISCVLYEIRIHIPHTLI